VARIVRFVELVYGAGRIDRRVTDAESVLREWRVKERDWGQLYLEYQPVTPKDHVLVEDLAVTMLINSRVAARAATAVYAAGATLDLSLLPDKPLEETTNEEREAVASVVGTMASWPWIEERNQLRPLLMERLRRHGRTVEPATSGVTGRSWWFRAGRG
jgi:hypothetical protein